LDRERSVRLFLAILFCLCATAASAQQGGPPKVPVEAAKVATGAISERITSVGSLTSNESVIVRPEIAGRVVEIGFQEGQPVKQGDLLIRLDDSLNRAEVAETEARRASFFLSSPMAPLFCFGGALTTWSALRPSSMRVALAISLTC
jgi:multidrug efflux pump subunit AcrA (membrane-fusion protein)